MAGELKWNYTNDTTEFFFIRKCVHFDWLSGYAWLRSSQGDLSSRLTCTCSSALDIDALGDHEMENAEQGPRTEAERRECIVWGVERARRLFDHNNGQNVYMSIRHLITEERAFVMQQPLDYLSDRIARHVEEESKEEEASRWMLRAVFCDPVRHLPSNDPIALCRVGLVIFAYFFAAGVDRAGQPTMSVHPVAVKIMDDSQLQRQGEDIGRELQVMQALRPEGFRKRRPSPLEPNVPVPPTRPAYYFPQWSYMADAVRNQYLIADFATNKSLIQYSYKRLHGYTIEVLHTLAERGILDNDLALEAVRHLWREEARSIFAGLVNAIDFMHSRDVCHLDLSPDNVGIDGQNNPILLDFGSGELLGQDGLAGRGRAILCKPHFGAREVFIHNLNLNQSPGVDGKAADMYSLGAVLYWLVFIGYRWRNQQDHRSLDPMRNDARWLSNLVAHVLGLDHTGREDSCAICHSRSSLDAELAYFRGLLTDPPNNRMTAAETLSHINQEQFQLQGNIGDRCDRVIDELINNRARAGQR